MANKPTEYNRQRIAKVIAYIEEHYTERISQQEVAQKFGFTKEYFARVFHNTTGKTFMEYVNDYRLDAAKELLSNTNQKVMDIGEACGFADTRGFINAFQRYYEVTPLQYRKNVRKGSSAS
jgi:AraC-like DNA-binding protein